MNGVARIRPSLRPTRDIALCAGITVVGPVASGLYVEHHSTYLGNGTVVDPMSLTVSLLTSVVGIVGAPLLASVIVALRVGATRDYLVHSGLCGCAAPLALEFAAAVTKPAEIAYSPAWLWVSLVFAGMMAGLCMGIATCARGLLWSAGLRVAVKRHTHCIRCDYDLQGLDATVPCPECRSTMRGPDRVDEMPCVPLRVTWGMIALCVVLYTGAQGLQAWKA